MSYDIDIKCDVTVEIRGEIVDIDTIDLLANILVYEAAPEFDASRFDDEDEIRSLVLDAIEAGKPLRFYRSDTGEEFGDVRRICEKARLAYKVTFEPTSNGDVAQVVWAPGFKAEEWPMINRDHKIFSPVQRYFDLLPKDSDSATLNDVQDLVSVIRHDHLCTLDQIPATITATDDVIRSLKSSIYRP